MRLAYGVPLAIQRPSTPLAKTKRLVVPSKGGGGYGIGDGGGIGRGEGDGGDDGGEGEASD